MKTQAWGWLIAAVVAAGLNASYHEGGLEWAHRVADRVGHNTAAALALANGHTDQFLAEANMLTAQDEAASCRWSTAVARVQTRVARAEGGFAHFEAMSARQEAQLARLEANRARIEAQVAAQTARIRIPAMALNPVVVKTLDVPGACPRLRISVPRPPRVRIPAPPIHLSLLSAGPV